MSDETIKTDAGDGSASANTDNTAVNPDGGNNTEAKVEFTQAQQDRIQGLIDASYQRAYTKAQESGNRELEKLRAEMAEKKPAPAKGTIDSEEVQRIVAENKAKYEADMNDMNAKLSALNDERKKSALLGAISKHNVMDISDVAQLISGDVEIAESGELVIKSANGAPKIDASTGLPMSVETYLESWLKERPHHLRANMNQGGGSAGSKFGEGGAPKVDFTSIESVRNATSAELKEALDKGVTITGAQGQEFSFGKTENPFLAARKNKFSKTG